jgi:hypothetical protein
VRRPGAKPGQGGVVSHPRAPLDYGYRRISQLDLSDRADVNRLHRGKQRVLAGRAHAQTAGLDDGHEFERVGPDDFFRKLDGRADAISPTFQFRINLGRRYSA